MSSESIEKDSAIAPRAALSRLAMTDPHADFVAEAPPGYVTQAPDVAYWAERAMFDHLRAMSPIEKLELIDAFQLRAHLLQLAGLAHRFPHATSHELELRAAEIRLGKETVAALLAAGLRPPWAAE